MGVVSPVFPVCNFVPVSYIGDLSATVVQLLTGGGTVRAGANGGQQILQQGHQSKTVNCVYNWGPTTLVIF
jgi:hypothetical protein